MADYFGIGIDTVLPVPRSAIQIVSPAGSTAVGVVSHSFSTVTTPLSPVTVIADIFDMYLRNKGVKPPTYQV